MGYNVISGNRNQPFLIPPTLWEMVPPGNLAPAIIDAVDQLDLSEFWQAYNRHGEGQAFYHPAQMLALILYCYVTGQRSARMIERACRQDVGAWLIMARLEPDHATVARFVIRHLEPMKTLLVQVLELCVHAGLVDVTTIAGDGTVWQANAAKKANRTGQRLDAEIAELRAQIETLVEEMVAEQLAADAGEQQQIDPGDDNADPPGPPGPPGPPAVAAASDRLARLAAARDRISKFETEGSDRREHAERMANAERRIADAEANLANQRARQQAALDDFARRNADRIAAGRPPHKCRLAPVEQHIWVKRAITAVHRARARLAAYQAADPNISNPAKANTTDPDSRLLPGKRGGFRQAYNIQGAVTTGPHQICLAPIRHDNPNDVGALHPLLTTARGNCDAAGATDPFDQGLFDTGYAATDNFTSRHLRQLFIAIRREAVQTGRDTTPPRRPIPASHQAMADLMDTPTARQTYKQRGHTIEPMFAAMFDWFGRRLHYRGNTRLDAELSLIGAAYNLRKLLTAHPATATA